MQNVIKHLWSFRIKLMKRIRPIPFSRDCVPESQKARHLSGLFKSPGFSLIEMLIVLAIFSFVIAAIFGVYTSQQRTSVIQAQVSDAQQNARIGMDFLTKEIRMAGFGMPETAVNGFANAINTTNSTAGPDQITIITGYRQISTLSAATTMGSDTITLSGNADKFNAGAKKYVYLGGISNKDNYQVTLVTGNQLTITPTLKRDYIADSPVFLVKAISYSVNSSRYLTRNENTGGGTQRLVPNIEDLQLAYQDVDGTWSNSPATPGNIRAVRINVLARTPRQDAEVRRSGLSKRPAIEDRSAAGATDGYRRRFLTSVVKVRNMGL